MYTYATLHQVQAQRDLLATDDEELLLEFLQEATGWINRWKGRRYDIRQETRYFDIPSNPQTKKIGAYPDTVFATGSNRRLSLDDDLLHVVTLTNGDGVAIASAGYRLLEANHYPKHSIELASGYSWAADANGETHQVIAIDGLWGYHSRYSEAWADSGDSVKNAGGITANGTSITVTDADGVANDLAKVRFQAGQIILIESEFLFVTDVNTTTNVLTVSRGYNGSTAAAHDLDDVIYIWRPEPIVVRACKRLVQWMYTQKDTDSFDRTFVAGTGVVSVPTALPADIRAWLGAPKVELL